MSSRIRLGVAAVTASAFILTPTLAAAASCSYNQGRLAGVQLQMADLVLTYPGIHVVAGLCAAGAESVYRDTGSSDQATGTFLACAGLGCLMAGFSQCYQVVGTWFKLGLEAESLSRQLEPCNRR